MISIHLLDSVFIACAECQDRKVTRMGIKLCICSFSFLFPKKRTYSVIRMTKMAFSECENCTKNQCVNAQLPLIRHSQNHYSDHISSYRKFRCHFVLARSSVVIHFCTSSLIMTTDAKFSGNNLTNHLQLKIFLSHPKIVCRIFVIYKEQTIYVHSSPFSITLNSFQYEWMMAHIKYNSSFPIELKKYIFKLQLILQTRKRIQKTGPSNTFV